MGNGDMMGAALLSFAADWGRLGGPDNEGASFQPGKSRLCDAGIKGGVSVPLPI
jgi:hypothetical protein